MTPRRRYPLQAFLITLGITLVVWLLRGFAVLAFMPGAVLWVLILLCFSLGIISTLQRIR